MSALDLRTIARATGGEAVGRQVNCPGPGHSRIDRSLGVKPSASSPVGFVVHSYVGDDFATCRDFVLMKLGMPLDAWRTKGQGTPRQAPTFTPREPGPDPDDAARIARARAIWDEAGDAHGTVVARYLGSRGLKLDLLDNIQEVIRFHPRCPWRDETVERTIYVPAMVAALRTIAGDEITGIHRTRLTPEGAKVDRRMLGIASGAVIKLDSDDTVTMGLAVGEGIESCLAARQLEFRPVWAVASAGAVASFPTVNGVEALTLLAENDAASDRAISQCAERWHQAGREVTIVTPNFGSDLNDVLGSAA